MSTEVKRIEPLVAAKVALLMAVPAAILFAIGGFLLSYVEVEFLRKVDISNKVASSAGVVTVLVALITPLISAYVGALITAVIYNFIAKHFGGLKLDLSNNN